MRSKKVMVEAMGRAIAQKEGGIWRLTLNSASAVTHYVFSSPRNQERFASFLEPLKENEQPYYAVLQIHNGLALMYGDRDKPSWVWMGGDIDYQALEDIVKDLSNKDGE